MAWFRTHLLMFWVGLILLKTGFHHRVITLCLVGVVVLAATMVFILYKRKRFSVRFQDSMAVGTAEVIGKKILSTLVFMAAVTYGIYTAGFL